MHKATILIIDDEPAIRKLLSIALESEGYAVELAETGKAGIIRAAHHPPDLILLDLGLPDQSGHVVLTELKSWYPHSIIILSVLNEESDIVKALDQGAADYLTKPFRMAELLARIRSALRRNNNNLPSERIESGTLFIDLAARVVKQNNETVRLTATEFKLLALLARHQDRVLTHTYILKEIWGVGFQQETQYLRVFIAALRRKIEADANHPRHILTETGIGYRFV